MSERTHGQGQGNIGTFSSLFNAGSTDDRGKDRHTADPGSHFSLITLENVPYLVGRLWVRGSGSPVAFYAVDKWLETAVERENAVLVQFTN